MRRGAERMAVACGENSGPQGRRRSGAAGGLRPPNSSCGRIALRAVFGSPLTPASYFFSYLSTANSTGVVSSVFASSFCWSAAPVL